MKRGNRIYYNQEGQILFQTYDIDGDVLPHLENEVIQYIDLPYGDKTLENALEYHIENNKLVISKYREHIETEEEKLRGELLKAQSEVVNLKYKEVLNNINK